MTTYPAPDPVTDACRQQVVQLFYRGAAFNHALTVGVAVLLAAGNLYAGSADALLVGLWLAFVLAVVGARQVLVRRFEAQHRPPEQTRLWFGRFAAGALMSALGWAAAAALFMPGGQLEARVFTAVIVVGTVTGAVVLLGPSRRLFGLYALVSVTPIVLITVVWPKYPLDYLLGVAAVLFVIAVYGAALRFRATLLTTIRMGIERALLIEELERARDEAHRSSQAKSDFLANMSHEVRTPINAIIGFADVALLDPAGEEVPDYLQAIRRSARALLQLLNDVLDISKIEVGKLVIERTDFSLDRTLAELLDVYTMAARGKGLAVRLERDPAVPDWVEGDPLRVHQVLSNLLSNAIKFTETGHVVLAVRLVHREGDSAQVAFTVVDTGVGIPADKQALVFETFAQADASTTRRYGGTGLGLAISQQLVRMMGGAGIVLDSTPGRGSRFDFVLPLGVVAAQAKPAPTPKRAPSSELGLLVADDEADNRRILAAQLRHHGFAVRAVANGQQALAGLDEAGADAIVLDMQMPVMDGLETTCRIRQREALLGLPRTPIVMVTASASAENRETCLAAGVDRYLVKPVEVEALVEALAQVLGTTQS